MPDRHPFCEAHCCPNCRELLEEVHGMLQALRDEQRQAADARRSLYEALLSRGLVTRGEVLGLGGLK